MRTYIKQCRYCIVPKAGCQFRQLAREKLEQVALPVSAFINCPEYNKKFEIDQEVHVKIYDQLANDDMYRSTNWEWQFQGFMKGKIVGLPKRSKFFVIKLDYPVKSKRVEKENNEIEVVIEYIKKISRDIYLSLPDGETLCEDFKIPPKDQWKP